MIGDSHSVTTFPLISKYLKSKGHTITDTISNIGWAVYSYTKNPESILVALEKNPDAVIVSLGGNNNYTNSKYGEKVYEFLDLIGHPRRKVVWISPYYATRQDVQGRHEWTFDWLSKNLPRDIPLINVMKYQPKIYDDGVHYPKSSHEYILEEVNPKIHSALKSTLKKVLLLSAILSTAIALI